MSTCFGLGNRYNVSLLDNRWNRLRVHITSASWRHGLYQSSHYKARLNESKKYA